MNLLAKYRKLTKEDRKQIEHARKEIRYFETKYGLSSEDFIERWRTSTEPLPVEDVDANLWVTHFILVGKKDDWKQIEYAKEEKANSREYTDREIQDFLAADRLDAQTANKVSRLLGVDVNGSANTTTA